MFPRDSRCARVQLISVRARLRPRCSSHVRTGLSAIDRSRARQPILRAPRNNRRSTTRRRGRVVGARLSSRECWWRFLAIILPVYESSLVVEKSCEFGVTQLESYDRTRKTWIVVSSCDSGVIKHIVYATHALLSRPFPSSTSPHPPARYDPRNDLVL